MNIFKKSGKNKNKLRTIYPKNHEHFKNSKPRVEFYWFLYKKEWNGFKFAGITEALQSAGLVLERTKNPFHA